MWYAEPIELSHELADEQAQGLEGIRIDCALKSSEGGSRLRHRGGARSQTTVDANSGAHPVASYRAPDWALRRGDGQGCLLVGNAFIPYNASSGDRLGTMARLWWPNPPYRAAKAVLLTHSNRLLPRRNAQIVDLRSGHVQPQPGPHGDSIDVVEQKVRPGMRCGLASPLGAERLPADHRCEGQLR
jgi:hypothetical protein